MPGSPAFHAILKELAETHEAKDAEYSGSQPLSNYRTAEEWGDPAWKSSLLRAEEKRKRLQNQWLAGKELRRDDFIDLLAHWINTLVLWEESKWSLHSPNRVHSNCSVLARQEKSAHGWCWPRCHWGCNTCGFYCG